MQKFFIKYKALIIGIVLGALAGFLFWRFVGCASGTCPITSRWYNAMIYGMIVGALLGSPARKREEVNPK